jgi:hypothetical protein
MGGRGGGMGARVANQKGVSRANAFGLNFKDTYLDDKLDVQGSYFFNMTRTTLDDSIANDYINLDRSSIQLDDKLSHNYSHRLDMRISYKPNDNNEIMFRPSFNYQKTDADGLSQGTTWNYRLGGDLRSASSRLPEPHRDPQHQREQQLERGSNSPLAPQIRKGGAHHQHQF